MTSALCFQKNIIFGVVLCASVILVPRLVVGQTGSAVRKPALTPSVQPIKPGEVAGITSPKRTATLTLAALQPARIIGLPVTQGQDVIEGEVLVILDDGVQRLRTEIAEAKARSLIDIESTQVRMEQAFADQQRLQLLMEKDSAGNRELLEAQTKAKMARMAHEVAKFEHQQATREYEHQRLILQRMTIRAPFSGYITNVYRESGETVTATEPILRVVQLDMLEVAVDCPLELAQLVVVGKRVVVRPADSQWTPRVGEVIFTNSVADPASQTFKAKVVLDNRNKTWIAGLKVLVDFATAVPEKDASTDGSSHSLRPGQQYSIRRSP
jgi:RND family efflux transporter MFP subunit